MATFGHAMSSVPRELGSKSTRSKAWLAARSGADPLVTRYMTEVNRYPLLSRDQEQELARQYQATRDVKYAHQLVNANLRFVVKIAHDFRGYNVPLLDLIQEGNIGLMMAIRKFDPMKGCRLVSYGVWWIRAYMGAYSLRSWSLVRVGTTQAQRKLFFSLRAARHRAEATAGPGQVVATADLAHQLSVKEAELADMDARLAGQDISLDARIGDDGRQAPIDRLPSALPGPEETVAGEETAHLVRCSVRKLAPVISVKQRYVLEHRVLSDRDRTLKDVGDCLDVSRERVRQIEGALLGRLEVSLRKMQVDRAV